MHPPGYGDNGIVVLSRTGVGDLVSEDAEHRLLLATVETDDGPLRLLAVHPRQPTQPVEWHADQERLLSVVRSQHPTLVVGDFNATLDQAPLRDLEDEGYRSVTELLNQGWQRTWPANGRYRPLNLFPVPRLVQIDQVMLGTGLAAIDSHTVHIHGTDHLGLVATFAAADEGRFLTVREPLEFTAEEQAEEAWFNRTYGPWEPLDVAGARAFFDGFDRPWWLVGGYAIEAFTGALREHEDIDVSMLAWTRRCCASTSATAWDLWTNVSGRIRPMTERWPDLPEPDCQIWVRRDWRSPWVMDLPLTPEVDGLWQNKRLPDHVRPARRGHLGDRRRAPGAQPRDRAAVQVHQRPAPHLRARLRLLTRRYTRLSPP